MWMYVLVPAICIQLWQCNGIAIGHKQMSNNGRKKSFGQKTDNKGINADNSFQLYLQLSQRKYVVDRKYGSLRSVGDSNASKHKKYFCTKRKKYNVTQYSTVQRNGNAI